jgi:hypothetical protein
LGKFATYARKAQVYKTLSHIQGASDTVPIFSGQSPRQLCNLPFEPGKVASPYRASSGDSVVRFRDPEMLTGAETDDLPAAIC